MKIGVFAGKNRYVPLIREVLDLLAQLFAFKPCSIDSETSSGEFHGIVYVRGDTRSAPSVCNSSCPSSIALMPVGTESFEGAIRFTKSSLVPAVYRGREVCGMRVPLGTVPGQGEILAETAQGPLWTCELRNGVRHDTWAVLDDWFKSGDCLFQHLRGPRLLDLLPLIHWLKSLPGQVGYEQGPLRACLMFDDPNLHSPTYGFISFSDLADHARANGYHAAMATVPLDGYWFNERAAAVFRENPRCISILIHGNNHTKRELGQPYSATQRMRLVQESLARIERLENRAGVNICRVMAAPHGRCSEAMLAALAENGYESAAISSGSLKAHNGEKCWTRTLGLAPVEMIAGLPVMNRQPLRRGCESYLLLAAYLGQPIISVGHHWDLVEGLGLLGEIADFINSLGTVSWMSMQALSRSNYRLRLNSGHLEVELLSRFAEIAIPPSSELLTIHTPWLDPEKDQVIVDAPGNPLGSPVNNRSFPVAITVANTRNVRIRVRPLAPPAKINHFHSLPLLAFGRRIMTEVRDRSMVFIPAPLVKRVSKRR